MDPADQDAVRHTLEAQGRLLGQLDQLFADIWTLLQTLNASGMDLLSSGQAEQGPLCHTQKCRKPLRSWLPPHRRSPTYPSQSDIPVRLVNVPAFCSSALYFSTSSPSPTTPTGQASLSSGIASLPVFAIVCWLCLHGVL